MVRERIEDSALVANEPMTNAVDAMLDALRTWHGALATLRGGA